MVAGIIKKMALKLFGRLADSSEESFEYLKETLLQADIHMLLRTYLSLMYFFTFLSFLASFTGIFFYLHYFLGADLILSAFYSLLLSLVTSFVTFGAFLLLPSFRIDARKRNIETNLPFAITHMSAIASSGVPPSTMFRLITEFREYGEISKEAEKIVRNIDVFGIDVTTAIREVAKKTPSATFKEFLEGVATTIDTGGNLYAFLQQQSEKAMFEYRMRREKYLQTLSTYADFYTAVLIAAPLFLVAILSIMSLIEGKLWGMNIEDVMKVGIYIGIPAVNTIFLLFLHLTQPEM